MGTSKKATKKSWKAGELLYKYRSLSALHFLIDIIRKKELYAAQFTELNDPMEGMYRAERKLTKDEIEMILRSKMEYRICALSKKNNSTLMWAHYADSHRGVVLGVRPRFAGNSFDEINVEYTSRLNLWGKSLDYSAIAKEILSKKFNNWEYEEEVRILTTEKFVPIQIEEVLIGCNATGAETERIKFLFEKTVGSNKIRKLDKNELDVNMGS